jgi:acetyl esterase/lipase
VDLAAATTLAARDRGGPKICAQLLCNPVLDDTMGTSAQSSLLIKGERRGTRDVSMTVCTRPHLGLQSSRDDR